MPTRKTYDLWAKWHGGECPVPPDTLVQVQLRSGFIDIGGRANVYDWHHDHGEYDIVEYRTLIKQSNLEKDQMTTKKIYDPWIKWHGGGCPVSPDTKVGLRFRSGATETGHRADEYSWCHGLNDPDDIVEYCVAIEQTDLEAAENLLLANGYKITPPTRPLTFEDVEPMMEAPPEGTEYWVVSLSEPDGVFSAWSYNDDYDYPYIKRRIAYLDKEHALIAARHIFGLKGGEL